MIQHVIVLMQENRSFDTYFGTFPGADGIPMKHGVPTVCLPDTQLGHCIRPYHDPSLINQGGPHGSLPAVADVDGGKMDGFVSSVISCYEHATDQCRGIAAGPRSAGTDTVGWHDAREIPNYWFYAHRFVLQDHMFEGVSSWSLPAHLDMVSGWSATCADADPMSCKTDLGVPGGLRAGTGALPQLNGEVPYAYTDLTYLLHAARVSWGYFVSSGTQPDCPTGTMYCEPKLQYSATPDIWNPLPGFETVHADGQLANVQPSQNFFSDATKGTLPAVSWVVPNGANSEHPPASIANGQAWVTSVVNAVMNSPDWNSSAIFLSWDDWGGFYDHVHLQR
jgi:phospholipase C